mmetsp:Transcript_15322/g.24922  ORF Transcript_15322/g.24922 Transcript_15322/m.24922 type:complete len:218 (-) Transcript_15322:190-843(-)
MPHHRYNLRSRARSNLAGDGDRTNQPVPVQQPQRKRRRSAKTSLGQRRGASGNDSNADNDVKESFVAGPEAFGRVFKGTLRPIFGPPGSKAKIGWRSQVVTSSEELKKITSKITEIPSFCGGKGPRFMVKKPKKTHELTKMKFDFSKGIRLVFIYEGRTMKEIVPLRLERINRKTAKVIYSRTPHRGALPSGYSSFIVCQIKGKDIDSVEKWNFHPE